MDLEPECGVWIVENIERNKPGLDLSNFCFVS